MTHEPTFADFNARLREFIRHSSSATQFEALALELFQLQFQHNAAYRRLVLARGVAPQNILAWRDIPAVPASAFKELELTSLAPEERSTVFFSSGTTEQRRSRHFHSAESLALYEASLRPWFERHLLADMNDLVEEQLLGPLDKLPLLVLTPPPAAAPNSSLAHMFDTVRREFGARDSLFAGLVGQALPPVSRLASASACRTAGEGVCTTTTGEGAGRTAGSADGAWSLDLDTALSAIRKSIGANRPLVLLGTAFNFVHLLDHFTANPTLAGRYQLARGSRVLETGGYKGQSREVPKTELHALITKHLGVGPQNIVTEYGMSELSSQAYDRVVGQAPPPVFSLASAPAGRAAAGEGACATTTGEGASPTTFAARIFHFPPWCRAQVISPENGREVAEGETGLLRIFDLANVRSVLAIQTEDLAVKRGDAFELIGRATQAEPRGCSLMSLNAEAVR